MSASSDYAERVVGWYEAARRAGLHDRQCEYRVEGFYLCHCSKRRREAADFTEPPADELYFPPPSCPRCDTDLGYSDGWSCDHCSLAWNESGNDAHFTDEYDENLSELVAKWDARRSAHQRPSTPEKQLPEGGTRITMKRACNGCHRTLGDATEIELACAVLGAPLPDVRIECGCGQVTL